VLPITAIVTVAGTETEKSMGCAFIGRPPAGTVY
jgi:hypothetical protein